MVSYLCWTVVSSMFGSGCGCMMLVGLPGIPARMHQLSDAEHSLLVLPLHQSPSSPVQHMLPEGNWHTAEVPSQRLKEVLARWVV